MNNEVYEPTEQKYFIYSIDVWGNEDDGWEQNDYCQQGWTYIEEAMDELDVVELLIEEGYLKAEAKGKVDVEFSYSMIEIYVAENLYPLYQLRLDY